MMFRLLLLVLTFALASPAVADLQKLLAWQQRGDSGAYVSSGFHDYRAVSKYRRYPGLHAGYDIAMLAGSPVRAAWAGRVVAIIPWYGAEHGVTVRDAEGYEATYGHISPSVSVGEQIVVGETVGTVVVDHVDVKMRDRNGRYVDFRSLELASASRAEPQKRESAGPDPRLAELARRRSALLEEHRVMLEKLKYGLVAAKEVERLERQLKELPGERAPKPRSSEVPVTENKRTVTDRLILNGSLDPIQ